MSEMVDRVARALFEHSKSGWRTYGDYAAMPQSGEAFRLEWAGKAQVAIEAMQEPTDEMIDFGQKIYTETSDVRDAYVAMVHTAYSRDIPY